MFKRAILVLCGVILIAGLTGCKPKTCSECGDEVYKDGLCDYHYELKEFHDKLDDTAKDIYDSIFGDSGEQEE